MDLRNIRSKLNIYSILLCLIFAIGFLLRLKFYILNFPLWHDECSLAQSIINKDFWGYFGLLNHTQSAPPIFMIISKLVYSIFGIKEFSFRLFPFICGIFSIPVFYYFSKLFIDKKWILIVLSFLFAINFQLIHYSVEFKQYSSDVFLFMLVFIGFSKINLTSFSYKKLLLLGFICGFLPMLSIPLVFVILGFFLQQVIKHKKDVLKKIFLLCVPILFLWGIYLFFTIIPQQMQKLVMDGNYWENGFLSFNLIRILSLVKVNLLYYLYPNKLILFTLISVLVGLYYAFKNIKNSAHELLLCSLSFVLIASFLKYYPLYERVSLYLIPVVFLLMFLPLNEIKFGKNVWAWILLLFLALGVSGYNYTYAKSFLNKNLFPRNDARTAMYELKNLYLNSKSYIIVGVASDSEFNFYKRYFDFNPKNILYIQLPNYSKSNYFNAMEMLPNGYDYWFYYAYDYSHSPVVPFLKEWSKKYSILFEKDIDGAYLLHIKK